MVKARILVSDAETAAALAVARSLGRAGHHVGVLAWCRHAAAAASRYVRAAVPVPDPVSDPDGWTEAFARTVRRSGWDLFLPVTDTALLLADRARGELEGRIRLAMPAEGSPALSLDKPEVLDRASAAGVPVLTRWSEATAETAPLPAVVKPRRSRVLGFGCVRGATAVVVGDRRSLADRIAALSRAGLGAYVEPWVPGEGRGVFLLRHEGRVLARFAHRRIREASPLGGPSAVAESASLDAGMLRHAEAIARELDLEGPFMAEFRGRGESFVLLEVNARFWGSLGLAVDAGVDFPALHVRALLGDATEGPAEYSIGVRRRNLAFDLRRAARAMLGLPTHVAIPWPGRLRPVADLALERAGGLFRCREDPAPARAHGLHLIGKALRHGQG